MSIKFSMIKSDYIVPKGMVVRFDTKLVFDKLLTKGAVMVNFKNEKSDETRSQIISICVANKFTIAQSSECFMLIVNKSTFDIVSV